MTYPETSHTYQRFAAAAIFGQLEAILASGYLSPNGYPTPLEISTRKLLAEALAAFGMPSKEELERRTA
jgi:hypothetical protein